MFACFAFSSAVPPTTTRGWCAEGRVPRPVEESRHGTRNRELNERSSLVLDDLACDSLRRRSRRPPRYVRRQAPAGWSIAAS